MKIKNILLFMFVVLILTVGVVLGLRQDEGVKKEPQQQLVAEAEKAEWLDLQGLLKGEISQFKGEVGIVVKDLETGWEFSHEKTKLFPAASLTKIPLLAACYLAADQGRIKLKQEIVLASKDKFTGSGVLKSMSPGAIFSVERLAGLMIYDSDNTATNIVTNLVGLDYLNDTFEMFGLKHTRLLRKIADYQARDKGLENYTTAEDMALLLDKIYQRNLGNKNISDKCISVLKLTRMNDRIPRHLPPEITVAHKTGLERGVCHDAGIVFTRKGDFIIVVLTKHANPNSVPSKEFIAEVSLHAYNYIAGK